MNGFKLIAIVPLSGCDHRFSKNLEIGKPYKFYKNYEININEKKEDILSVINRKDSNEEFNQLYNLKNGIKINISAVVGENGSGKSTLIELFYYFVYAASIQLKQNNRPVLEPHSNLITERKRRIDEDIKIAKSSKDLFQSIQLQNKYSLRIENFGNISSSNYMNLVEQQLEAESNKLLIQNNKANFLDNLIRNNLNVAVIFETSTGIHIGKHFQSILTLKNISDTSGNSSFSLTDFFYSICLNFSHHSLNSKTIGGWINSLFHKNDAYTTPVVINPMRDDGNFNINRELKLSCERIMSNVAYDIVQQKDYLLLGKYKISKFLFSVKKQIDHKKAEERKAFRKISPKLFLYTEEEFNNLSSASLLKKHLDISSISDFTPFIDYAISYLESKIPKIVDQYWQFFADDNNEMDDNKFYQFILTDESHITKKVRQTINFLKATYKSGNKSWNSKTTFSHEMSVRKFREWLKFCNKDYEVLTPSQLMEFALPGFFNVDFELKSKNGNYIKLSDLSSGEQQILFNIHTITYHLYNIQSVHNSKTNIERIAYKNVAVILDEVELYYHPEMQRNLVSNILDALELIKSKDEKGIESINLCFLTHSPFILSDIPNSNILKLKRNKNGQSEIKENDEETFGANINDLMADSFFLEKTSMGAFAEKKINQLIDKINDQQKLGNEDVTLLNQIGDTFLKSSLNFVIEKNKND